MYRIWMDEADLKICRGLWRVLGGISGRRGNNLPSWYVMRSNKKSNYRFGGDISQRDLTGT